MGWGCLGRGVYADRVKGLFRDWEGHDVEPFGGVDIHGLDIGSPQSLDLFFCFNQESMFQKRGPEPRAVDSHHIHPNLELM